MGYPNKVLWILKEYDMSRKELCELIDKSLPFLSNVIGGKKKFGRDTEELLISKLNLPRDFFVSETLKTVTVDEQLYFNQLFPEATGTAITLDKMRKLIHILKD